MLLARRLAMLLTLAPLVAISPRPLPGDEPRPRREFPPGQVTDAELVGRVDARLDEWRIAEEERPLDAIGWAGDLLEARELARRHERPVFLFTYDGRMTIGRC